MAHRIISTLPIRAVAVGGKDLMLAYATETVAWSRNELKPGVKEEVAKAIENMKEEDVPDGAHTAIMLEGLYPSPGDPKPHYTVAMVDKNQNHLGTKHVYEKK